MEGVGAEEAVPPRNEGVDAVLGERSGEGEAEGEGESVVYALEESVGGPEVKDPPTPPGLAVVSAVGSAVAVGALPVPVPSAGLCV